MEKPYATTLTTVGVIRDDVEIDQVEIRVTLKPGVKSVGSTIHGRAVALWLAQHQDEWLKFCIATGTMAVG